ncbi:HD domain-containing protein [Streptomyces sp. NPDC017991]|uniref:HD domain-containing protein n=1 Tax=Streptomyces sp. NPDC017991 TaxID=3365026 RepID=UPI00379A2B22
MPSGVRSVRGPASGGPPPGTGATTPRGTCSAVNGPLSMWARQVAEAELRDLLPRRCAHSQGVAQRAAELVGVLGDDSDLLASAAVLHDVGYAPRLGKAHTAEGCVVVLHVGVRGVP